MKFVEAVLLLSGMIIGVGMFGIPFSFAKAGFWLGTLELLILTGLMALVHLSYARIIMATPTSHRLPGFARMYLGSRGEIIAGVASFFGIIGSLLAYILIGSVFLHNFFQVFWTGSNEIFWAVAITVSSAAITLFNLKKEAIVDSVLSAALLMFLGYIIVLLFPGIEAKHLSVAHAAEAFLPYGVLLFALGGSAAIPDVVGLLGRDSKKINRAVILGSIIPGIVYFLFALAVVGVVGAGVSEEAIESLKGVISPNIVALLSLVGFLAVYDSYIILNSNAQALLTLDFHFPRKAAWFLATAIPFGLYAIGLQNFILIIGATGAIAGGFEIALIVLLYQRVCRVQGRPLSNFSYFWKAAIFLTISVGVAYELYRTL